MLNVRYNSTFNTFFNMKCPLYVTFLLYLYTNIIIIEYMPQYTFETKAVQKS